MMRAKHADCERLNDLSGPLIGCVLIVLNTISVGFLENVQENVLALEACAFGLRLRLPLNFGKRRRRVQRVAHGL